MKTKLLVFCVILAITGCSGDDDVDPQAKAAECEAITHPGFCDARPGCGTATVLGRAVIGEDGCSYDEQISERACFAVQAEPVDDQETSYTRRDEAGARHVMRLKGEHTDLLDWQPCTETMLGDDCGCD